jgi:hypothetical protein
MRRRPPNLLFGKPSLSSVDPWSRPPYHSPAPTARSLTVARRHAVPSVPSASHPAPPAGPRSPRGPFFSQHRLSCGSLAAAQRTALSSRLTVHRRRACLRREKNESIRRVPDVSARVSSALDCEPQQRLCLLQG